MDNYFEYDLLIYTLSKQPYRASTQYRQSSGVEDPLVARIDLIFDQFVLFEAGYSYVRELDALLPYYADVIEI